MIDDRAIQAKAARHFGLAAENFNEALGAIHVGNVRTRGMDAGASDRGNAGAGDGHTESVFIMVGNLSWQNNFDKMILSTNIS